MGSIISCAMMEMSIFLVGLYSPMPAVAIFALNAALAVFLNMFFQLTLFITLVYLDTVRVKQSRCDILCFFKNKIYKKSNKTNHLGDFFAGLTRILMKKYIKALVVIIFTGMFAGSLYIISFADIGLDQNLSVSTSSYLYTYFNSMEAYLNVGVPVYFVVEGIFPYQNQEARKLICGSAGCDLFGLSEQISRASHQPKFSTIETPAASWLDDYLDWLEPISRCCSVYRTDEEFCHAQVSNLLQCKWCVSPNSTVVESVFTNMLPDWLEDNPDEYCSKGGHAAYSSALSLREEDIEASHFMSYHSICIESSECQANLEQARVIADNITHHINRGLEDIGFNSSISVWPYSIYYPYYEQYITMGSDAIFQLLLCMVPISVLSFVCYNCSLSACLVILITVVFIVTDTYACCVLWNVQFNPLTLINLIASSGLAIEFTGHSVRHFIQLDNGDRIERTIATMRSMGPVIILGVTMTNLPGIVTLHWAHMQIIEIFFFRMSFLTTISGAIHACLFLPVLLSIYGKLIEVKIL